MSARSSAARLPHQAGVYRFRDRHGRILYLGRATDLRSRVQSYWGDLRDRRHLAKMVAQVARVEAVACGSVHEAAWLERNLLETHMPPWNRTAGEETSIYIVVDTRPHTAGVRTSYVARFDGVVGFGPYLGGMRTRQAVSGLHRAFSLSYTRDRLTAAERDIATRRGIGPQSRKRLAAAVISALDGTDAGIAREVLTAARDRAAAALNFELAARIHSELAALEWVTSVQRVTVDGGGDQDVCGWADGLAVTFTIRGGRLNGWDQRECGRSDAARASAVTPPEWAEFAQRNAELAAALIRV
ncbi:GIY-YIG nuclease family protein [Nonomuraea sp. NBC_00507]|uniref:GIY-YIG nuclease family protein n=1 Tax=Nonomuraea sp. NBC_00507 TaxID=2976002 RepID=UPI002E191769